MVESASYSRRGYKGGCVATTIPAGLAAGATSATLTDASTWAGLLTNGNARLMVNRTGATPEEIEISGLAGNVITISARGLQGTSDTTHAANATIEVIHSPRDFNEANAHIADTTLNHHTQYILKTLYDANTILAATTDDTPAALTVGASTFLGRKATGNIAAMTVAEAVALTSAAIAATTDITTPLAAKVAKATFPVSIGVALSDETTAITTGTAKVTIRAPFAFTLTDVRASLATASSSGIPTVDINESATTVLSTKLTIDANELTSTTAATAAVISDSAIADDAILTFDIDVAGTGAKGLKVWLYGTRVVS